MLPIAGHASHASTRLLPVSATRIFVPSLQTAVGRFIRDCARGELAGEGISRDDHQGRHRRTHRQCERPRVDAHERDRTRAERGPGATSTPRYVSISGNALWVTHSCRAQFLDPLPTSGAVASGAQDIGTGCVSWGSPGASAIANPWGIATRPGEVWVANSGHGRLMRWTDTSDPVVSVAPVVQQRCDGSVTVTWSTDESGTAEAYWDTVSRVSHDAYTFNSIRSTIEGLQQTRTLSGLTPGVQYFYRVRTVDWAGRSVVSNEASFVAHSLCGPTDQYSAATNAQTGSSDAIVLGTLTPRFSWRNRAAETVDRQRTQVVTTPLDDVLALWPMEGNGTDSSGNGRHLTEVGGPTWPASHAGAFGQAAALDGVDDHMHRTDSALDLTNNFTVDTWVRESISNGQRTWVVEKGTASNRNFTIDIDKSSTGSVTVSGLVTTSTGDKYVGAYGVPTSTWIHVALVVTPGNVLVLYVDGIARDQLQLDSPVTGGMGQRTSVGAWGVGGGGFGVVRVDDVRITARAMTAQQLRSHVDVRRPHNAVLWDSDTANNGVALGATCVMSQRCADVVYGSTGTPVALQYGGRYHVRSRLRTPGGAWTEWSRWDAFELRNASLTLSLPDGAALDLGTTVPDQNRVASMRLRVTTSNVSGFTLHATGADDAVGLARAGGGGLPWWTGTPAAPTPWPEATSGHVGVTVLSATGGKDAARWGPGATSTSYATLNYAGLRTSTPTVLHATTAAGTDHDTVLGVRARISGATLLGSYSTALVITAVANP